MIQVYVAQVFRPAKIGRPKGLHYIFIKYMIMKEKYQRPSVAE